MGYSTISDVCFASDCEPLLPSPLLSIAMHWSAACILEPLPSLCVRVYFTFSLILVHRPLLYIAMGTFST